MSQSWSARSARHRMRADHGHEYLLPSALGLCDRGPRPGAGPDGRAPRRERPHMTKARQILPPAIEQVLAGGEAPHVACTEADLQASNHIVISEIVPRTENLRQHRVSEAFTYSV